MADVEKEKGEKIVYEHLLMGETFLGVKVLRDMSGAVVFQKKEDGEWERTINKKMEE